MILKLLLIVSFFLAPPDVKLNWLGAGERKAVRIWVDGYDSFGGDCVKNGLALRLRFESRLCYRRFWWVRSCGPTWRIVQTLQFDPISDSYKFVSDQLDDEAVPAENTFKSVDEGMRKLMTFDEFELSNLVLPESAAGRELSRLNHPYMAVRVWSECRGEYNETLERISYLVSFGLVRTSGFDSGWFDFGLAQ